MSYIDGHASRRPVPFFEEGKEFRQEDHGYHSRCWVWLGTRMNGGYGCISRTRDGQRQVLLAHRISYEQHRGAIPEGLAIDHLCEYKLCVNPDHLEAVTRGENTRRAIAKRVEAQPRKERARGKRGRGAL